MDRSRFVAAAAALSWLLPCSAMVVVGFAERGEALLPFSRSTLVVIAASASVVGVILGVTALALGRRDTASRAPAAMGTAAGALVLAIAQVASVSGAAARRDAEATLREASEAAVRDYPGWNGNAQVAGARVFAVEIDAESAFAKILLRPYDRPYLVVLFGVDNRAGDHEVVLDLAGVRLRARDGAARLAVPRAEITARSASDPQAAMEVEPASFRVGPGEHREEALAFFPPTESLRDVQAIEVGWNGARRVIEGRYFTLEEKRAIDAARGRSARRAGGD